MFNFKSQVEEKVDFIVGGISALVAAVAIFIILHLKGYPGFRESDFWDSIKDLAQLLGTIGTVLIASYLMRKRISGPAYLLNAGNRALKQLQVKYPNILIGPKYDRQKYDKDTGHGRKYLFIYDKKSNQQAVFISLDELKEGICDMVISQETLSILSIDTDKLADIQKTVYDEVKKILDLNYEGQYCLMEEDKESLLTHDIAISIEFEKEKIGLKRFQKAVYECSVKSVEVIKKHII